MRDEKEQNLALVVNAKERSFPIVIDETTTLSKNKKLESEQQESASTSSSSGNEVYLNHFYDSDECVEVDSSVMNDSSIFLKNIVICHNCNRLQSMLDDANKTLLKKERIIDELNAKIIELGSKVKEDESVIKESRSQNEELIHSIERCVCVLYYGEL
jgi:hypothetical protein